MKRTPIQMVAGKTIAGLCFAACATSPSAEAQTKAGAASAPRLSPMALVRAAGHLRHDTAMIEIFCLATLALVLYPVLRFLMKQWSFRRDRLYGELAGDPIIYYYLQFRPGQGPGGPPPLKGGTRDAEGNYYDRKVWEPYLDSFRKDFNNWYGRRYYIMPLLILAVVTAASAYWTQKVLREWAIASGPGVNLRALTASALAGAFVWVISDEIDRLRRRDFTTSDIYYSIFRILLAIPFAWALSAVQEDGHSLYGIGATIPLAFFLGAFPTTTLFTLARRIASQQLKLGDDAKTGNELEKLMAVTKTNAERFRDEGIVTITQLAYADPIDLTIRTNFDFNYVVDCVSQALAWIYFGDNLEKLSAYSLRGAQEIVAVMKAAGDATHPEEQMRANQTIDAAAALLQIDKNAFRSTLDQVAEDPYSEFLVNVWS
jgi:hypothetical protein